MSSFNPATMHPAAIVLDNVTKTFNIYELFILSIIFTLIILFLLKC